MKRNILSYIILLLLLYYINFVGRIHGLFLNFIITGIVNFIITFYLLKINPFKKVGLSLIFLPFLLLSVTIIYGFINDLVMPGIVGYFMYIISTLSGIILFKSIQKVKIAIIYSIFMLLAIFNYYNILNIYYAQAYANEIVGEEFPEILVTDKTGTKYKIESNNKIKVIDLWSNSCANCIASFPKFEKIKNDYKNDMSVEFFSINIYDKHNDILKAEKFIEGYTFNNYYSDKSLYKLLNFNAVPYYVVVGKDNKIKYFGNLNTEAMKIYNNMYKIIDNEK